MLGVFALMVAIARCFMVFQHMADGLRFVVILYRAGSRKKKDARIVMCVCYQNAFPMSSPRRIYLHRLLDLAILDVLVFHIRMTHLLPNEEVEVKCMICTAQEHWNDEEKNNSCYERPNSDELQQFDHCGILPSWFVLVKPFPL
jgi:hypothetical protein